MIRHILKILWNERRTNVFIVIQYTLVFSILWFCFDYLCYIGRLSSESHGFDIEHTYLIKIKQQKSTELSKEEKYEFAQTLVDRISKYPGIESISLSITAVPYGLIFQKGQYHLNGDSVWHNMEVRQVTPAFFDVFRIKIESGKIFGKDDFASKYQILISGDKDYRFGNKDASYPVSEVHTMKRWVDSDTQYNVIGITERQKGFFFDPYFNGVYFSMQREDIDLANNQIAIRVKPAADRYFAEQFKKEMRKQLHLGPYYLSSITPIKKLQKLYADSMINDNINGVISISVFLMLNIFLCIIGTFWFRTQARRNEVGLRIALGASKKNVRSMLYLEALMMIFLASVLASYLCLNLGSSELLHSLGIPVTNRTEAGIGPEQDILNYLLTFLFLVLVSFLAISYPAKISTQMNPAEALRDE